MKILVLNCGSSSIKYKLFEMTTKEILAQGGIEKIGLKGSFLKLTLPNGEKVILEKDIPEHTVGVEFIFQTLTSEQYGVLKSLEELDAVGHRMVHGGERFSQSVLLNKEALDAVKACNDLAPLHNPANLKGVAAVSAILPNIPQVGVFDTAFKGTDHHADGKQCPRKAGEKENDGADPFQLEQLHAHIAHEGKEVAEKAHDLPVEPIYQLIQDCRGDKIPNKYCSFTSGDATRPPPFRATALTAVFTYFIVCPKLWVSLLSGSYPSFWRTKS